MRSFNKLHILFIAFLVLDLGIIYLVYQKYFKEEPVPHKSFFVIEGEPLSGFLAKAPKTISQPHTAWLETPFFSENVTFSEITRNGMGFSGIITGNNEASDLSGKIEGFSKDDDNLQANLELFSGKLERGAFTASRLSGKFEINETASLSVMVGDMDIGRIRWGDIPLGGITATLRGTPDRGDLKIKGQMSGHQGTSFEATAKLTKSGLTELNGTMTISNPTAFNQMLQGIAPNAVINLTGENTLLFSQTGTELRFFYPRTKNLAFILPLYTNTPAR